MEKTLYVTDLDGTLLNKNDRINPQEYRDHQQSGREGNGVYLRDGKVFGVGFGSDTGAVNKHPCHSV